MLFDFESIRNRLITNLESKASWADVLFYSTNQRILDPIAEELSNLALYADYVATETKWKLAKNTSSLTTQAKPLGYTPHRKKGAIGILKLSVDENYSAPPTTTVPIPKWTLFSNGSGIYITSINTENITVDDDFILVDTVQGVPKSETFIAQGDNYEEFELSNQSVENTYYEFEVNGVIWTEVDDLRKAEKDDTVFKIENNYDFSGIRIITGNNIFGKKTEAGDTIIYRYVETNGASGNILSSDIVTTVESTIKDIDLNEVNVFCKNESSIVGGTEVEDIEDIRTNGSSTFQAGDRASRNDDYVTILKRHPFVSTAVVWGAYETNIDNGNDPDTFIELEQNVVHMACFAPGGILLTEEQENEILEYLNIHKAPTDIPRFEIVEFINLIFNVYGKVKDRSYTLSEVKSNVISALSTEYDLDNMDFWKNVNESDYKAFIDGIPGIDHHTTSIELFKEFIFEGTASDDGGNTYYQSTISLPLFPITAESIKLYIRDNTVGTPVWELSGLDNGYGLLVGQGVYDLGNSNINYVTGQGSISYKNLPKSIESYSLKLIYSIDNKDLVLKQRNHIFRYADSNVDIIYTKQ